MRDQKTAPMSGKEIPMKLTISKIQCGSENIVEITMYDDNSNTSFASMQMTPADFAICLMGLARVKGVGSVKNLDHVGKKHEHKKITYTMPDCHGDDREKNARTYGEAELKKEGLHKEGWVIADNFISQDSFNYLSSTKEIEVTACIRRWI